MNLFFVLSLVWVLLNDINSIQGSDDDDYEPNESDVQMFFSSCQALKNKYIVRINEVDQELLHNQAELNCYNSILNSNDTSEEKVCSTTWDTVLCWPQTPLNKTIRLQCPNYINKFNTRNGAYKTCILDSNTSEPVWSLTNYDQCFESIECSDTKCSIEHHIEYIVMMRVVGYVASLLALTLSIAILLRSRLRCPRNFVHINLFLAFSFRTILTMLCDVNPTINSNQDLQETLLSQFKFCKMLVALFFYSGSVFTVAITTEALYLVMLLKNPFYSEKKGSIICIILSWVLPVVWMTPWVAVRIMYHDFWCWQTESQWNLIIKIPHSLLLIINICFSISIIKVLYLKTVHNHGIRSHENYTNYRNFAKSILILIPVFGLHFIFFAWLPYAKFFNIKVSACFEIVIFYIETFFNAFQGLAVAVMCCLKYHEVHLEMVIIACNLMKKFQCFKDCFQSDTVTRLRFSSTTASLTPSRSGSKIKMKTQKRESSNQEMVRILQMDRLADMPIVPAADAEPMNA